MFFGGAFCDEEHEHLRVHTYAYIARRITRSTRRSRKHACKVYREGAKGSPGDP